MVIPENMACGRTGPIVAQTHPFPIPGLVDPAASLDPLPLGY